MRRTVAVGAALLLAGATVPSAFAAATAASGVRHVSSPTATARSSGRVLRVGTWHGIPGQYQSIQAAVNHAKPGDTVLVGPGDYKTKKGHAPHSADDTPAGVLIRTPGITLRGMNRNGVVVDGTRSGPPCSTARSDQNFGPTSKGQHEGLNGVMVWKAAHVKVENLTACNFLHGPAGDTGNEIWWNGGDGSGKIGGHHYHGSWLTGTTTYFRDEDSAAQYGIFSSNWNGGSWNHTYASNFNDSGLYIGACRRQCHQTVNHTWAEFSVLGYSGSNSGGKLVVENSEFDHNEDGFDTNSQNGDNPPPQNGACPHNRISPITHTSSCWVFMHNYVHDNNNPNVPGEGLAAEGPVGTGMSVSGGRNDTVMDNVFVHNKAWGVIFVPFPDSGPPCRGGTQSGAVCLYDEWGDALLNNHFGQNGGYGNPTNGDFAFLTAEPHPTNCFRGNKEIGGGQVTSSPSNAQQQYPRCTGQTVPPNPNPEFFDQVACDSQATVGPVGGNQVCPAGSHYPRRKKVIMHPLPGVPGHGAAALQNPMASNLRTMRNPCAGVPANPWCPAR